MFDNLVFMSKMWFLLTLKNCSNESENARDCIDFGLFFNTSSTGGGGMPPDLPRLRICSIDSSTRQNFALFSQQSVTGYDPFSGSNPTSDLNIDTAVTCLPDASGLRGTICLGSLMIRCPFK